MAKKLDLGTVLAISAVAAAVGGGVAAYLNREAIKETAQNIADKLGAKMDEDGILSADLDLDEDIIVHKAETVPTAEAPESDFVDADGTAEEAPAAEEAPVEAPEA